VDFLVLKLLKQYWLKNRKMHFPYIHFYWTKTTYNLKGFVIQDIHHQQHIKSFNFIERYYNWSNQNIEFTPDFNRKVHWFKSFGTIHVKHTLLIQSLTQMMLFICFKTCIFASSFKSVLIWHSSNTKNTHTSITGGILCFFYLTGIIKRYFKILKVWKRYWF